MRPAKIKMKMKKVLRSREELEKYLDAVLDCFTVLCHQKDISIKHQCITVGAIFCNVFESVFSNEVCLKIGAFESQEKPGRFIGHVWNTIKIDNEEIIVDLAVRELHRELPIKYEPKYILSDQLTYVLAYDDDKNVIEVPINDWVSEVLETKRKIC